jgi:uncharacterized protein YneR
MQKYMFRVVAESEEELKEARAILDTILDDANTILDGTYFSIDDHDPRYFDNHGNPIDFGAQRDQFSDK